MQEDNENVASKICSIYIKKLIYYHSSDSLISNPKKQFDSPQNESDQNKLYLTRPRHVFRWIENSK